LRVEKSASRGTSVSRWLQTEPPVRINHLYKNRDVGHMGNPQKGEGLGSGWRTGRSCILLSIPPYLNVWSKIIDLGILSVSFNNFFVQLAVFVNLYKSRFELHMRQLLSLYWTNMKLNYILGANFNITEYGLVGFYARVAW
jgi:hypothetical protein